MSQHRPGARDECEISLLQKLGRAKLLWVPARYQNSQAEFKWTGVMISSPEVLPPAFRLHATTVNDLTAVIRLTAEQACH